MNSSNFLPNNNSSVMNSSHFLPPGFRFQPSIKEIFTYFLPQRLMFGYNTLPSFFKDDVLEVDLYESKSPEEIFLDPKKTEFYFFTTLVQKHSGSNKKMKRDIEGKGTWSCKSRPVACNVEIQGRMVKVGTKNLFKFIHSNIQSRSTSWIMHEYLIDKDYLNNLIVESNININNNHNNNLNEEKIAFCYAYKKTEKVEENVNNKRKGGSLKDKEEEVKKDDGINNNNNNNVEEDNHNHNHKRIEFTTNNNNNPEVVFPLAHGHGREKEDTKDNNGFLLTCGEDYLSPIEKDNNNNGFILSCGEDYLGTTMEKDYDNDNGLLMTYSKDVLDKIDYIMGLSDEEFGNHLLEKFDDIDFDDVDTFDFDDVGEDLGANNSSSNQILSY